MAEINESIHSLLARLEAAAAELERTEQERLVEPAPLVEVTVEPTVRPSEESEREKTTPTPPVKAPEKPAQTSLLPTLTPESLIHGVLYTEILGRPVSQRRGRGRFGI
ncbi:MAG: hypothetical protein KBG64_00315 [Clostridia bacterium]|nr:hypothetical protein [Clostridia bacterium]